MSFDLIPIANKAAFKRVYPGCTSVSLELRLEGPRFLAPGNGWKHKHRANDSLYAILVGLSFEKRFKALVEAGFIFNA